VTCFPALPYLSATATGLDGTTSEFFPSSRHSSHIYLPLIMRQVSDGPQEGIYGHITSNSANAAGIYLDLRFYNGSAWSTQSTTVTGADGAYQFSNVPGLGSGQIYYVRYLNGQSGNADNPTYLYAWYATHITNYTGNSRVPGGDWDIADIPLVSPGSGASVTLPATFRWTKRNITADSYRLVMVNPALQEAATTNLLGYIDSVTVNSLPSNWLSGNLYYWWMEAHHGDGTENYGIAYGTNAVTIFHSLVKTDLGVALLPLNSQSVQVPELHERALALERGNR
jgi:hypothetical protein